MPSAKTVSAARSSLSSKSRDLEESTCGAYSVLSTAPSRYLSVCQAIAPLADQVYERRLGLKSRHPAAGLILIFGSSVSFREYASGSAGLRPGYAGFSKPSRGIVAVLADEIPVERFVTTLAHELAHMTHRRVFGGRLGPWLSEGLADAIGDTATPIGFEDLDAVTGLEPLAERLRGAIAVGRTEPAWTVMVKSRAEFDKGVVSYDYETSALLVRFLLLDHDLGPRFRTVLARLASPEGCDLLCLLEILEVDGPHLDRRFKEWLGAADRAADS